MVHKKSQGVHSSTIYICSNLSTNLLVTSSNQYHYFLHQYIYIYIYSQGISIILSVSQFHYLHMQQSIYQFVGNIKQLISLFFALLSLSLSLSIYIYIYNRRKTLGDDPYIPQNIQMEGSSTAKHNNVGFLVPHKVYVRMPILAAASGGDTCRSVQQQGNPPRVELCTAARKPSSSRVMYSSSLQPSFCNFVQY